MEGKGLNLDSLKIEVKISYKRNIFENKKILTETEIKNCTLNIGQIIKMNLSNIEDELIKKFLDSYTEYGKAENK